MNALLVVMLLRLPQQLKLQSRQVGLHLLELRVGTYCANEIHGVIVNHLVNTLFLSLDGLCGSNDFFNYFPEAGSSFGCLDRRHHRNICNANRVIQKIVSIVVP